MAATVLVAESKQEKNQAIINSLHTRLSHQSIICLNCLLMLLQAQSQHQKSNFRAFQYEIKTGSSIKVMHMKRVCYL